VKAKSTGELGQRLLVVLDPQIDAPSPGLPLGRDHHKGSRHLAAGIAPSGLAGLERGEETNCQFALRLLEGRGHRRGHALRSHHVRLAATLVAGRLLGIWDAAVAGEPGRLALDAHHAELACRRLGIGPDQPLDGLRGGDVTAQHLEAARPERDLNERLRGDRADPRRGKGDNRAHRGPGGEDRNSELASARITGNDRSRHAYRRSSVPS
jgi:hypothetical protein